MKKSALGTVFLVVLIDLMGFGIVLPLIPFYAARFNANAVAIGLLYSVYSFAQLIFSPIWGRFSDRIGRRPIMLMSTCGAVAAYILFGLSGSLAVLFLSRLLAGITAGNISTAQAYVADVTTPEERAKGMGLIGAAFGIGFMAGPALATALIHPRFHDWIASFSFARPFAAWMLENKYAVPGYFAAMMSFISFLLVLFKLPEPVKKNASDSARVLKLSLFSRAFWKSIFEGKGKGGKAILPFLMFAIFLLSLGQSSLYSAFPLFCKSKLGLSAEKVGLQFAIMGLVAVFVQGGLIRVLVKRFDEKKLFVVGTILMVIGLALIPFAGSQKILALDLALMTLGASLNGPTLTSLISKEADPAATGTVMGSSQGLSALGRAVGPTWGGFLFGWSIKLPFLATAALVSLAVFVGLKIQE